MEKEIKQLKEKLNKISAGCEICRTKMCSLCPNGKMKKNLREKIKQLSPEAEVETSILKKFFSFFT